MATHPSGKGGGDCLIEGSYWAAGLWICVFGEGGWKELVAEREGGGDGDGGGGGGGKKKVLG